MRQGSVTGNLALERKWAGKRRVHALVCLTAHVDRREGRKSCKVGSGGYYGARVVGMLSIWA